MNQEMIEFINDISDSVVQSNVKENMIKTGKIMRFFTTTFSTVVNDDQYYNSIFQDLLSAITPIQLIDVFKENNIMLCLDEFRYYIKHPELKGTDLANVILDDMEAIVG